MDKPKLPKIFAKEKKERIAKILFGDRGKIHTLYGWDNLPQFRKDRWFRKAEAIVNYLEGING